MSRVHPALAKILRNVPRRSAGNYRVNAPALFDARSMKPVIKFTRMLTRDSFCTKHSFANHWLTDMLCTTADVARTNPRNYFNCKVIPRAPLNIYCVPRGHLYIHSVILKKLFCALLRRYFMFAMATKLLIVWRNILININLIKQRYNMWQYMSHLFHIHLVI